MAKDPAAVSLGRRGGEEYARTHTAEERKAQARKAAQARWAHLKSGPGEEKSSKSRTLAAKARKKAAKK